MRAPVCYGAVYAWAQPLHEQDDESGVFTGRGIPVVCEGDEVVPMDVLYNVHGWLFMYLVSKVGTPATNAPVLASLPAFKCSGLLRASV